MSGCRCSAPVFQLGKGDFKVQPEIAIALSSFGESGLDVDQRTRFGSRVGPESNQPETQAPIVFQFPPSKAPGVVPAQIIFATTMRNGRRLRLLLATLPAVLAAFPTGVSPDPDFNSVLLPFDLTRGGGLYPFHGPHVTELRRDGALRSLRFS